MPPSEVSIRSTGTHGGVPMAAKKKAAKKKGTKKKAAKK
jgi:hypothetical protein